MTKKQYPHCAGADPGDVVRALMRPIKKEKAQDKKPPKMEQGRKSATTSRHSGKSREHNSPTF